MYIKIREEIKSGINRTTGEKSISTNFKYVVHDECMNDSHEYLTGYIHAFPERKSLIKGYYVLYKNTSIGKDSGDNDGIFNQLLHINVSASSSQYPRSLGWLHYLPSMYDAIHIRMENGKVTSTLTKWEEEGERKEQGYIYYSYTSIKGKPSLLDVTCDSTSVACAVALENIYIIHQFRTAETDQWGERSTSNALKRPAADAGGAKPRRRARPVRRKRPRTSSRAHTEDSSAL